MTPPLSTEAPTRVRRRQLALALGVSLVLVVGGLALEPVVEHDLEPPLGRGLTHLSSQDTSLAVGLRGIMVGGPTPWRWLVRSTHLGPVAVAAAGDHRTLYAGTDSGWVWRSSDGGNHWTLLQPGQAGLQPNIDLDEVRLSPVRPYRIYAQAGDHVVVSADGGYTWTTGRGITAAYIVSADPKDPLAAYAAASGFLYRTTDGGRTWQRWGRQAIPEGGLVLPGAS